MQALHQIKIILKAASQFRFTQLINLVIYKICLRSGLFRFLTSSGKTSSEGQQRYTVVPNWFYIPPSTESIKKKFSDDLGIIKTRADEIMDGKIRFFEGDLGHLRFTQPDNSLHWTIYEKNLNNNQSDIKFDWEPARFNWAILLAKAYHLTQDDRYFISFNKYWQEFNLNNPLNIGKNWQSGQEIALRLIALVISLNLFRKCRKLDQLVLSQICTSIAAHADRIPKTIFYAKAQNNNHLLSEAIGLYTAGVFLSYHPHAKKWKRLGMRWFNNAILNQIDTCGEYTQHSTNYHRMMLCLCLWMRLLLESENKSMPIKVTEKIKLASQWLYAVLDKISGQVPNMGHNDGSFILPLTSRKYEDYRPVVQAAYRAFFNKSILEKGGWDDLSIWMNIPLHGRMKNHPEPNHISNIHRLGNHQNWALFYARTFTNRPAHADQLHVDIWHQGKNLLCDAGTFEYNSSFPWDNRLSSTLVHNTACINQKDQMLRAGRFLWLDWAQAGVMKKSKMSITAFHDGYKKLGFIHQRTLELINNEHWLVTDEFKPVKIKPKQELDCIIQWLAHDWPFQINQNSVTLDTSDGMLSLDFSPSDPLISIYLNIVRGGVSLTKTEAPPYCGWISPTYGFKIPVISIQFHLTACAPISVTTLIKISQ